MLSPYPQAVFFSYSDMLILKHESKAPINYLATKTKGKTMARFLSS